MVSRRPPNPVENANLAWIPRLNSPLENTPHNARVVCVTFVATLVALLEMPAERRCAAAFDGTQHALLPHGQGLGMRPAKLVAVGAHNVGDFQCRSHEEDGLRLSIHDGVRE
jgi:hypothetical protein